MTQKTKHVILFVSITLLFHILVSMSRMPRNMYVAPLCFAISYFLFTQLSLHYIRKELGLSSKIIVLVIAFCGFLLELPIYIFDFSGTLYSLRDTITIFLSVGLSALCYRKKLVTTYALSTFILLFTCSFGATIWEKVYDKNFKIEKKAAAKLTHHHSEKKG